MSGQTESERGDLRLAWSGVTDVGRVRKNNEDHFLALNFDQREVRYLGKIGEGTMETSDYVFAVSDGMGGAKSGEFASRIVVDQVTRLLPSGYRVAAEGFSPGFQDLLTELFVRTDHDLLSMGNSYEECRGMGATLSLAWFTPGWMLYGHAGDSRIYYLPSGGGIRQLTPDDTRVAELVRQGKITPGEAKRHPDRSVLTQVLGGSERPVDPHLGAVGCEPGDRFILCSDGLTDGLGDASLEDLVRKPPAYLAGLTPAQRLVKEAVVASGRDNTTCLVVDYC